MADPARIASQIVPGIGFLGAGAIIQRRGGIQGLTTGATIWAVAAVGVTAGSGYAAAGVGFTLIIFMTLSTFRKLEAVIVGPCVSGEVVVHYREDDGKGLAHLQSALDLYQIPDEQVVEGPGRHEGERTLKLPYCKSHRHHRSILKDFADLAVVVRLERGGGGLNEYRISNKEC